MKARTIELDEDASKILDQLEAGQGTALGVQKERAERAFPEGRSTSWQEVKRKNGL